MTALQLINQELEQKRVLRQSFFELNPMPLHDQVVFVANLIHEIDRVIEQGQPVQMIPDADRVEVESSNIESLGWLQTMEGKTFLEVAFKNGTLYQYHTAGREVYLALIGAADDPDRSVGSTFNQLVRKPNLPFTRLR